MSLRKVGHSRSLGALQSATCLDVSAQYSELRHLSLQDVSFGAQLIAWQSSWPSRPNIAAISTSENTAVLPRVIRASFESTSEVARLGQRAIVIEHGARLASDPSDVARVCGSHDLLDDLEIIAGGGSKVRFYAAITAASAAESQNTPRESTGISSRNHP